MRPRYRNGPKSKSARPAKKSKHLVCVRCDKEKPEDAFVNDRTRSAGKFPWCKVCVIEYRRETRARGPYQAPSEAVDEDDRKCLCCDTSLAGAHPNRLFCSDSCKGKVRNWRIFGLEPDEYKLLIASNSGACPICGKTVQRWVLDHNHTTGETTGATCSICNQSLLSYSYHSVEIANNLARYLHRTPIRTLFGEPRFVGPDNLAQKERVKGWRKYNGLSIGLAAPQEYIPRPKPAKRIVNKNAKPLEPQTACPLCGTAGRLTKHHLVPRGQGGDDLPENLIWVCGDGTSGCHGVLTHRNKDGASGLTFNQVVMRLHDYLSALPEYHAYADQKKYAGWIEDYYHADEALQLAIEAQHEGRAA